MKDINDECKHQNKKVTDGYNFDDEVYYECPDCGKGWRQEPETEEDMRIADAILDKDIAVLSCLEQVPQPMMK